MPDLIEPFNMLSIPLQKMLSAFNLPISAQQQTQLLAYLQILAKWNKKYNLTAIREPRDMFTRLLGESISVAPFLQGERIIDVGSGAGVPGLPLSIIFPERQFTLLDSNGKKTRFLTQVRHELSLSNVRVIDARVETHHSADKFHSIMSRAFSELPEFLRLTAHLGDASSLWLAMKGQQVVAELTALPEGFQVEYVTPITILGLDRKRYIVGIRRGSSLG